MRKFVLTLSLAVSAAAMAGCSANPFTGESQMSDTAIGAGAGAAVGAGAGYAVGSITNADRTTSTLVGAGVGAATGAAAGMYMDKQNDDKRVAMQSSGVSVTRAGNTIALNLDDEISFAPGQIALSTGDAHTLNAVAMVMRKYPKTRLDVIGYADDQEGAAISKQRADIVVSYLASKGIAKSRLMGVGTSSLMATASRRVELNLQPIG